MNKEDFKELILARKEKGKHLHIAHRGVSSLAPGNSLTALKLGLTTPRVDGIEFDVQETRDHQLIVRHHRAVSIGGKSLWVKDVSLTDIRKLETAEETPLLLDVLEALKPGNKILDIEIKAPGLAKKIIDACKSAGVYERVIFTALYFDIHQEIQSCDPQVACIFGYPRDRGKDLAFKWWTKPFVKAIIWQMKRSLPGAIAHMMQQSDTQFVSLYYKVLTPQVAAVIKKNGGVCIGVTLIWHKDVRESDAVKIHQTMIAAGADAIKTDFPQLG